MSILPRSNSEALTWLQARAADWAENAPAIGLTSVQATAVVTATTQAQTAVDTTQAARAASKAATTAQSGAYSTMRDDGQTAIDIIKAFANNSSDPAAVYALAQVPPPAASSPQPPENPYDIKFELQQTGELELKWSGSSNGGSTIYIIERSVKTDPNQPASNFEILGYIGAKSYVDATIPACTVEATYIIKAAKGPYITSGSSPTTARFVAPNAVEGPSLTIAA